MKVLVDTPIWSLALRRTRKKLTGRERRLTNDLTELIKDDRIEIIGVVRQELLSGIRDENAYEKLKKYLHHFKNVVLDEEDYEEAAKYNNLCSAAGVNGSLVDFLICSVAVRRGLAIFTTDADFRRYLKHLPIQLYQHDRQAI